jgi:hypothetical protein
VGSIAAVSSVATILGSIQGSLQELVGAVGNSTAFGLVRRLKPGLRGTALGRRFLNRAGAATALIPLLLVLFLTTGWSSVAAWPHAPLAGLVLGTLATAIAVGSHMLAHRVAALALGLRVDPAVWSGGVVAGLLGLPLQMPAGPFPGERFSGVDMRTRADRDRVWLATVVGPIVNVVGAVLAFAVYLWIPMPFLRVLLVTHLAVAAFSLIATRPLDGSRLSAKHPWVAPLLALVVAAASAALTVGLA